MSKTVWIFKRREYTLDLGEAFQRLGWTSLLLTEQEMMRLMAQGEKPDLIIANKAAQTLGFEHEKDAYTVLSMSEERKIPLAWWIFDAWFFDPALKTLEQQAGATKLGLPTIHPFVLPNTSNLWTFTVNKEQIPHLKGNCVEYLPFGVNELRFKPMGVPKLYDVGFVGTSLWGDRLDGMTQMEAAGLVGPNGEVHLEVGDAATAGTWNIMCGVRMTAIARMGGCVSVNAHVWGDGWENVPSVQRHGRADWETDLPRIINETRINLNISKVMFKNDICPRVFEILACGGFIISNRIPGIAEEFPDVMSFCDNLQDLKREVEYWSGRAHIMDALGRKGRQMIEAKHTWVHRAQRILDVIGLAG